MGKMRKLYFWVTPRDSKIAKMMSLARKRGM